MRTMIFTHPIFLQHDTGPGHPEGPDRLRTVLKTLTAPPFARLERREAPKAGREAIERVHDPDYVSHLFNAIPKEGYNRLDPDTVICPASGEAALRAAGAGCAAVRTVLEGEADRVFCAVRPPGHHAEPARAMGFCLLNNVAIAALEAREAFGLERIAVVDFDVHHGNGTETVFRDDPKLFYASSHQAPFYPGTGGEGETGIADNIVNIELPAGSDSGAFRAAYEDRILPALAAFRPELLLISAGFDGHDADPLALMHLTAEDFRWVTQALSDIAVESCGGRIVSTLEGGYNLTALGESVSAHLSALAQLDG